MKTREQIIRSRIGTASIFIRVVFIFAVAILVTAILRFIF